MTILIIFFVLFPLTLRGYNPLLVSVVIAGVISLILAYTGSALPLLLLFIAGNIPLAKIINLELVAEEIARALAGSIGLVLCIPATALVAAAMDTRRDRQSAVGPVLPKSWLSSDR